MNRIMDKIVAVITMRMSFWRTRARNVSSIEKERFSTEVNIVGKYYVWSNSRNFSRIQFFNSGISMISWQLFFNELQMVAEIPIFLRCEHF